MMNDTSWNNPNWATTDYDPSETEDGEVTSIVDEPITENPFFYISSISTIFAAIGFIIAAIIITVCKSRRAQQKK